MEDDIISKIMFERVSNRSKKTRKHKYDLRGIIGKNYHNLEQFQSPQKEKEEAEVEENEISKSHLSRSNSQKSKIEF